MFLDYSTMKPVHAKCMAFLGKQLEEYYSREKIENAMMLYLKRIEINDPGTDEQVLNEILMAVDNYHASYIILDKIYELCSHSKIRSIVNDALRQGHCNRLRLKMLDRKEDSGALIGDLANL